MKTIKINSLTKTCMAQKNGLIIRKEIEKLLKDDEDITLDFNGIKLFASPFFNISLGYIISEYGEECFNKIKIINISDLGKSIIEQVKNNSLTANTNDKISEIVNDIEL